MYLLYVVSEFWLNRIIDDQSVVVFQAKWRQYVTEQRMFRHGVTTAFFATPHSSRMFVKLAGVEIDSTSHLAVPLCSERRTWSHNEAAIPDESKEISSAIVLYLTLE